MTTALTTAEAELAERIAETARRWLPPDQQRL